MLRGALKTKKVALILAAIVAGAATFIGNVGSIRTGLFSLLGYGQTDLTIYDLRARMTFLRTESGSIVISKRKNAVAELSFVARKSYDTSVGNCTVEVDSDKMPRWTLSERFDRNKSQQKFVVPVPTGGRLDIRFEVQLVCTNASSNVLVVRFP